MTLTHAYDDEDAEEEPSCDCFMCESDPVDGSDYCKSHQLLEGADGGDADA